MEYIVPTPSIVFMMFSALFGLGVPFALFFYLRKKYETLTSSFFIGCGTFFLFAVLLKGLFGYFLIARKIIPSSENIPVYAIFGGLMAGIFEESGRFIAFKTLLKNKLSNNKNAIIYGAGHGGFEAFYILFFGMMSNIIISVMNNNGSLGGVGVEADVLRVLSQTPPAMYLVGMAERLSAVAFHIAVSVPVWFAAKNIKHIMLYPLAVLLHALLNAVSFVLNNTVNVWVAEIAIYVITALCIVLAVFLWKRYSRNDERASVSDNNSQLL